MNRSRAHRGWRSVGTRLANRRSDVNEIDAPIEEYVLSNQENGESVYADIQELLVVLKIDVTSCLGVKINFVDTDGD